GTGKTLRGDATHKVDYEAELVVVMGKRGKHIPHDKSAFEYVGGYSCGHDVSARDWQFRGEEKQWLIGKAFDTFAPTGPVLYLGKPLPRA
ncbi:MAG TPA: fumarylacetoacetate hydrolase family protein, partial [Plasticicumulans sp.]|nr:fumarylacetoacetate hydrolase family protein [Plasticicumulans sp.]